MSVGANINRMRKQKGLSQTALAEKVGVTQSMVAQIERGTKMPTVMLAYDIAKVLDGTLNDLIDGTVN